ncbi:MAG: histidine kinase [Flavobacteriales bacterium]
MRIYASQCTKVGLWLTLVFLSSSVFAQNVEQLQQAFMQAYNHPDSAEIIAQTALTKSLDSKDRILEAHSRNTLGWAKFHQGDYSNAIQEIARSGAIFNDLKDTISFIKTNFNLAEIYLSKGSSNESVQHLLIARELAQKVGNDELLVNANRLLSIHYRKLNQFENAEKYSKLAMLGYLALKDTIQWFNTALSFSNLYREKEQYANSLKLLDDIKSQVDFEEMSNYQRAMWFENRGETEYAMRAYEKSIVSYSSALAIFDEMENPVDRAYENYFVGRAYSKLGNTIQSLKYMQTASTLLSEGVADELLVGILEEMGTIAKNGGDYKSAYEYLSRQQAVQTRINETAAAHKADELLKDYQAKLEISQVDLMKNKLITQDIQNQRDKWFYTSLISLLILLLTTAIIFYFRYRRKKVEELEKIQHDLADDLHDEIGSGLSSIAIRSKLLLQQNQPEENTLKMLNNIKSESTRIQQRLQEIVWLVKPSALSLEELSYKMMSFLKGVCEDSGISYRMNEDFVADIVIDANTSKGIYLIFREAVNNAVKHGQCTQIKVQFSASASGIEKLCVCDNGVGIIENSNSHGNGMASMKRRAQLLNMDFSILSSDDWLPR